VDNEGSSALLLEDRLYYITEKLEINSNQALKNIIIARAYNSDHLVQIIKEASAVIKEKNIKLLIVDGLISHFMSEYRGLNDETDDLEIQVENLFIVNATIRSLLSDLQKLAKDYNLIVVFTYAERFVRESGLGNPFKPVGGTVLAQENHTRIYLEKGKGDVRIAHLVHSPTLSLGFAEFYFSDYGIIDS